YPFERCSVGEGRSPASGGGSYRKRGEMRKVNLVNAWRWGHNGGAMKLPGILLALATLTAACGGGTGSPSTSPTAAGASSSPSASGEPQASASPLGSPNPFAGGYGVLVTPTSEANYTITLGGPGA